MFFHLVFKNAKIFEKFQSQPELWPKTCFFRAREKSKIRYNGFLLCGRNFLDKQDGLLLKMDKKHIFIILGPFWAKMGDFDDFFFDFLDLFLTFDLNFDPFSDVIDKSDKRVICCS